MAKVMRRENPPSDMIKQVIRGIQNIEQKVRGFSLLDPIEHRDGNIGAGDLHDILAMDLPGVIVWAHGSCIFPSDTRCFVSIPGGRVRARNRGWLRTYISPLKI